MFETMNNVISWIDGAVWGLPLIILILCTGIYLSVSMGFLQIRHLGKALKFMVKNEEGGKGEVSSFGALCTAMSATIGTGNIVGVATALAAGGPGALFWMVVAAFFGMATKYSEGVLAIKYRTIDKEGHVLGGPFYYIENGMGAKWKWLAKMFAFFGAGVGLLGIGTFTQVNGISSAVCNFFDPDKVNTIALFGRDYSIATIIAGLALTVCVGLVVIGGLKRIASVSQVVVPFMAIIYFVFAFIVIVTHITALPAAIVTIIIILVLSFNTDIHGEIAHSYNLFQIIPYVLVLAGGIIGVNVFVVLITGIISGIVIMLVMGEVTLETLLLNMGSGASGMFETCMVAVLVSVMCSLIKEYGGFNALLNGIRRLFKGKKGGQLGMGLLVGAMDIATANNTVAIVMANPIAKEMSEDYDITPRKAASLLDTFSCVFQGIIPYGAQMLVAISAVSELGYNVTAFQILPKLFYPMLLLVSSLIWIYIIPERK